MSRPWLHAARSRRRAAFQKHERTRAEDNVLKSRMPLYTPALLLLCLHLTGCDLVKGIFKAGVWVGVLGVFAVIALIFYGLSKVLRH
jgi:hypothetical protein